VTIIGCDVVVVARVVVALSCGSLRFGVIRLSATAVCCMTTSGWRARTGQPSRRESYLEFVHNSSDFFLVVNIVY
jgi:hypothetical protein